MYHIVEKRNIWFTISAILILPSLLFMIWSGITRGQILPLSIDYTGGTVWEVSFEQPVQPAAVRQVFVDAGYNDTTVFTVNNDSTVQIKFKPVDGDQKEALRQTLEAQFGPLVENTYRSLGPTIGREVSQAAVIAVAAASLLILLYIAWAFRSVPHPFRYGVAAIVALVHDVLVSLSFLAIMNLVAGWEIDALTLTALLTVIGYSVNDTVVIFDRLRENLHRYRNESFSVVANRSIIETATRSIGTQITVLLITVAILVLGGATLQQFVATMLVGFVSGMYSSIFNATQILAAWDERSIFYRSAKKTSSPSAAAPA
ncbi:MAG TPA: protein translocase subunit SecF [Chloroflexi bacterium]|nr:protein translocase subunit SecF [Chloroflexota bacterium]HHW85325.1 protein translocase subunit SecF [Chloroflexota bacterium]